MLAIMGLAPVALAGYALVMFLVATFTGCDNGKPDKKDDDIGTDGDDVPPDDGDASAVDDDTPQVDEGDDAPDIDDVPDVTDDDGLVDPDDDITDDDAIDTDLPDEDADVDPGCADVRTGFTPCVATFSGPIKDLDAIAGGVTAFGGAIPSIFRCTTNGLNAAACDLKAELPDEGLEASQYHATPFGSTIVSAMPVGAQTPIRIFAIDEAAATPAEAILAQRTLGQITIGSGSDAVELAIEGSGGFATVQTTAVPTERSFIGLRATNDGAATGLVGALANFDGDVLNLRSPGFPKGRNTMGMGATTLNLGSSDKEYVVAANAGAVDAADSFEAGIAIFDPEASSLLRVKLCGLGEVELAAIPEIAFDATGRKAYVVVESPSPALKRINLETCAEEMNTAIGANLDGEVVDMVVDGTTAYLADAGGKILFVDIATPAVMGSVALPGAPTACAMNGANLFCAWGDHLGAIDPATIELE